MPTSYMARYTYYFHGVLRQTVPIKGCYAYYMSIAAWYAYSTSSAACYADAELRQLTRPFLLQYPVGVCVCVCVCVCVYILFSSARVGGSLLITLLTTGL